MKRRLIAAVIVFGCMPAQADDLGREIYFGRAPTQATASLGSSGRELPAAQFPCANCHGRDARGGTEGAIKAPSLEGEALFTPTRERAAYDLPKLSRALEQGIDASGRPLAPSMPRYRFDEAELGSLLSFLKEVHALERTGVGPDRVQLILPALQTQAIDPEMIRAKFLEAWKRVDAAPYGRRLEVTTAPLDTVPPNQTTQSGFLAIGLVLDADGQLRQMLDSGGLPVLFPLRARETSFNATGAGRLNASQKSGELDLASWASASARLLKEALLSCGRDLTRTCVLKYVEQR